MEGYSERWNGRVWVTIPIGEGTPLHIDAKELIKQCFFRGGNNMYKVSSWAVSKTGAEIGGGFIKEVPTISEAADVMLPYLERAIRGGGNISGNIRDGFKFEDPMYNMADCEIRMEE
ncbi:MAG: hypothetical protein JRE23_08720 [Deltaproteobacteria bacterium]|nr:hypothetical protein [Deltaproteobacteria bacterium]